MPLYEYECASCHRRVEKIQKFSDPEITECPHCGGHLERVLSAPAVSFKGGGWYADLYSSSKAGGAAKSDSAGPGPAGGSSSADSSGAGASSSTATNGSGAAASSPAPAAASPSSDKK